MRTFSLLLSVLVALPLSACEAFDAVSALASYGVDVSDFGSGARGGSDTKKENRHHNGTSDCSYSVSVSPRKTSIPIPISHLTNIPRQGPKAIA